MRHMFSLIFRLAFIGIFSLTLVACDNLDDILLFKNVGDPQLFQSDEPIGEDRKTADIEINNSEEITLLVFQAALFSSQHLPYYRYLDLSEFPSDGSNFCQNDPNDERYTFSAPREIGAAYQPGDIVSLAYRNCEIDAEHEVNGLLTVRYEDMGGLNDTFLPVSTGYCVNRLQEELDVAPEDTYYVTGDEVRFKPQGAVTLVEVYEYSYDEEGLRVDSLRSDLEIDSRIESIVINEKISAADDALVSIDGNEVYSLDAGESELQRCQYYRRTLDLRFDDFSVKHGDITYTYNGTATLRNVSDNLTTEAFDIVDSSFSISVKENQSLSEFTAENLNINRSETLHAETYRYSIAGFLKSDTLGGIVELSTPNASLPIGGVIGKTPDAGVFRIQGRGLERITLSLQEFDLRLAVDSDGDDSRNNVSDAEETFFVSWQQLLSHDFEKLDYIAEE